MLATATPNVTLSDSTALTDEELLIAYDNAKTAGDRRLVNRHFNAIAERVEAKVKAAANAVLRDSNKYDAADRDIAVWTAIGKVATDDGYANVLASVRKGYTLANSVAAFITEHDMKSELDGGRYLSARGNIAAASQKERAITVTGFTADETMLTVTGSSYNMDGLEDALDAALFDAPTAADQACDWFRKTTNGHLTTDEQDVLLHSTGLTREVDNYLDDVAVTDPARAARAFNTVNPSPKNAARRVGPARLPQEHVGNIVGQSQQWVSETIDGGENAIFANTGLTRELRRGIDGSRRVIFEDITSHLIGWLKTYADQAGVTADEATVRAIPQAYWVTVMDEFGYDIDDYTNDDISDIIDAVIAGVVA